MPRIAQREAFRCFGNLFQRAIKFGIKIIRGIIAVLCVPCQRFCVIYLAAEQTIMLAIKTGLAACSFADFRPRGSSHFARFIGIASPICLGHPLIVRRHPVSRKHIVPECGDKLGTFTRRKGSGSIQDFGY